MRMDIGSNFTTAEALSSLSRAVDTYYTASIDHADGPCGSFFVSCGTFAGSFVATLQYSDDNFSSDITDEPDATVGNDVSLTLLAAGSGQINAPNPRGRYSRLKVVIGDTCVFGVTSVLGPLRSF